MSTPLPPLGIDSGIATAPGAGPTLAPPIRESYPTFGARS